MIERPMPQDILKYKAKILGNFSGRNIIWGGISVAIIVAFFFIIGDRIESNPIKILVSAIPAIPTLLIGFMDIQGQPFEKVAIPIFIDNFLAPAVRKKEIHYPDYEKWCKMNYTERLEYKLSLEAENSTETNETDVDNKDNKDKKKNKKDKKNTKFKVIPSKDYVGIK